MDFQEIFFLEKCVQACKGKNSRISILGFFLWQIEREGERDREKEGERKGEMQNKRCKFHEPDIKFSLQKVT